LDNLHDRIDFGNARLIELGADDEKSFISHSWKDKTAAQQIADARWCPTQASLLRWETLISCLFRLNCHEGRTNGTRSTCRAAQEDDERNNLWESNYSVT